MNSLPSSIARAAVALLCSQLIAAAPASAESGSPQRLAIRAGRLITGSRPTILRQAVVLIEGDRIKAVGEGLTVPANTKVIDLGSATLVPGLIDCHTHLLENHKGALDQDLNLLINVTKMGTARRALLGAALGREVLESGITTVRALGNSGLNGDVALRDAINAGWIPGPRILASTRALTAVGGQFGDLSPEAQKLIDQEYVTINGAAEARRAVRQAIYDGADCIKVIVDAEGQSPAPARILTLEEMKAIVEEAHRASRKVAAHAVGDLAARTAIEAGVDSIEHANHVSDEVFKLMARSKIFLVPTDWPMDTITAFYIDPRRPEPEERQRWVDGMKSFIAANRARLQRAMKAGVRIAAGSDVTYEVPGKTRGEASLTMVRAYAESGMTPVQIFRALTVDGADLLGWQDRIGAIESDKYADLIAVHGDPLQDITELERVRFVMKGGQIVKNQIAIREHDLSHPANP